MGRPPPACFVTARTGLQWQSGWGLTLWTASSACVLDQCGLRRMQVSLSQWRMAGFSRQGRLERQCLESPSAGAKLNYILA